MDLMDTSRYIMIIIPLIMCVMGMPLIYDNLFSAGHHNPLLKVICLYADPKWPLLKKTTIDLLLKMNYLSSDVVT